MNELSFGDAGRLTLPELLERRTSESPDRVAVVSPAGTLTYAIWLARAKVVSTALCEWAGTAPGDPVLVWTDSADAAQFVTAFHGVLDAGGIGVPLDDRLSANELLRFLIDCDARAAVISKEVLAGLPVAGQRELGVEDWMRTDDAGLIVVPAENGRLLLDKALAVEEVGSHPQTYDSPARRRPDDCAFLAFTSGSTGRPKGAMISHGGTVQLAERMVKAVFAAPRGGRPVGPADVIQSPIPAYLGTSIANNLYPAVLAGCPLRYRGRRFDPIASEQEMLMAGTTIYNGAPAHFAMMCQAPRTAAEDRIGVEVMITSGSPLTPTLYESMRRRWPGTAIANWYALNETMVGQTLSYGEDVDQDPTAVGRPVWPTELKIADLDGNPLTLGEEGEILLRSPGQMLGYFRNEAETAKRIQDGWIRTGDLGRVSPDDGLLRVTGRQGDRINRGAFKFYPVEVEEVLDGHEAVAEAAVTGVPHPLLGQDVVAFVALRGNNLDPVAAQGILRDYCRERLSRHKVPSAVVVVDQLPRNGFGKLLRPQLRAQWENRQADLAAAGQSRGEAQSGTASTIELAADITPAVNAGPVEGRET